MAVKAGVVRRLKRTIEVYGGANSINTNQVLIAKVDDFPVVISLPSAQIIDDGDYVILSGKTKRGVFYARAFYNLTQNTWDHGPIWLYIIVGIALLPIFLFGLFFLVPGVLNLIAKITVFESRVDPEVILASYTHQIEEVQYKTPKRSDLGKTVLSARR